MYMLFENFSNILYCIFITLQMFKSTYRKAVFSIMLPCIYIFKRNVIITETCI